MAFMDVVCVVESEYAVIVLPKAMRKEEGQVVANHFFLRVDPDFLAKDANAAGTAKAGSVVGIHTQASVAAHRAKCSTGDAIHASSELKVLEQQIPGGVAERKATAKRRRV